MMPVKPENYKRMNSESGEAGNTISTIKCANPVRPDPPV